LILNNVKGMNLETKKNREGEKGAAMVMALMMSFLLLVASAGLILESALNTQNVTDLTAEQQAYHAAESGIQSAVNVLRYKCTAAVSPCKIKPTPLLNAAHPDYHTANTISYSRALDPITSSGAGETEARLARWINYDITTPDSRVKLGPPDVTYSPINGFAYSLELADPDNSGSQMTITTSAKIFDHDNGNLTKKTYGSGTNRIEIEYVPQPLTTIAVSEASLTDVTLGSFKFKSFGTGAAITAINRFEIVLEMKAPFVANRVLRGFILTNSSPYTNPPKIIFDSQTYDLRGTDISLEVTTGAMRQTGSPPFGYEFTMLTNNQLRNLTATVGAIQPTRLLIRSTGYGPRGAIKQLEAIIQNNFFNGLGAPATITMVGPPSTTSPATTFVFDPGNSNAMLYSGEDAAGGSSDIIPPVGVTSAIDPVTGDDPNLEAVTAALGGKLSDNVVGVPSNVSKEVPEWLSSPSALDTAVKALYNVALSSADDSNPDLTGRYFASGTAPTSWGDNATGTGITFCDGNCTLGPIAGGGILVVTGTLTLHGNFSFNGLIIVTGQGGVIRSGGGNGTIQGNLVVAPYVNNTIAGNLDPANDAGFLAPRYQTSGGGNSTITYNSNNQMSGLTAISNMVLGVVEK
jgi:hypothetical protein